MLINLRNALMTGKRLSYDAEVEYLENTVVNQANYETIAFPYIDTGIPAADDVGVRITYEYRYLATGRGAMVCGSFVASGSGYFGVYNYGAYNYKMWGGATKMPTQIHVGEVLTTSLNFMESGAYEDVLNGATINSGSLSGLPTFNPGSVWAFAINKGNYSIYEIARLRIYGLKITKGSTLVRDFIPVRKGTVGYLYDRVSGALFGNAGTGDFVLGQDVVPVEWLQSSGTQYIDTGVVPGPGLDYSISFAFTSMSSYSYIMGAWSSNNSNYYDLAEQSNTLVYAGLGTTQRAIANIPVGVFSTVEKRSLDIYIDGVKKKSYSADIQSGSISSTILLFGVHRNYGPGYIVASQPLRVSKYSLTLNGTDIRKFLPVRVGTEGAMIDTLTRRIYRNQGTGAFTYGNDLKYPIPAE